MHGRIRCTLSLLATLAFAAPAAAQAPVPGTFTLAQFEALRFIEGDWKGSGYAPGPFYERYSFVDDSTMEMSAWDSTFTRQEGETNVYMFRGGRIFSQGGKAAVIRIDSLGYHFSSLGARPHPWVFRRVSADRWTATLGAAGKTVYTMDRVRR